MGRTAERPKKRGKPRPATDAPYEKKLARIAFLDERGYTQDEIAADSGVRLHRSNVSRALAKIADRYREEQMQATEAKVGREERRINAIFRETWREYERSKLDAVRKVVEASGDKDEKTGKLTDQAVKSVTTTEGQCGDPSYLRILGDCIDKKLRLLGAYAPTKVAQTDPTGTKAFNPYDGLTLEEMAALAKEAGIALPGREAEDAPPQG